MDSPKVLITRLNL